MTQVTTEAQHTAARISAVWTAAYFREGAACAAMAAIWRFSQVAGCEEPCQGDELPADE